MGQQLEVIINVGLQASGKSTWSKERVKKSGGSYKRINKDDLRAMVDNDWTPHKEKFIISIRNNFIITTLEEGFNVIVDDTNLFGKHIDDIKELVKDYNVKITINDQFLKVPIETCIKRDKERGINGGMVGAKVIVRTAKKAGIIDNTMNNENWYKNDATRYWKEFSNKLDNCIICDLDGTLSIMHGNRTPYEANKCDSDLLNKPVAEILEFYSNNSDAKIILLSGRSDKGKKETEKWLSKHNIKYDELHMRVEGDMQSDTTLKSDMYKKHIENKYNVKFVLDDRDCVVKTWRDLGLLCLQVYWGAF